MIGFALCGSFCTHSKSLEQMNKLTLAGYEILPIVSENVYTTDTRFGTSAELMEKIKVICGREAIHTICDAEPIGPSIHLDAMIVSSCTGNTLSKMANGITDTAVCMAAKAHLRNDRPLIIAPASNDALSANLKNIAALLAKKCVYFVPMYEDDPSNKPHSLVARFELMLPTLEAALAGKQYRKIFG